MSGRVLIINTGGTLSMKPTADGYIPSSGFLADQMSQMSELEQAPMPEFEILEHDPLIDSSDVTPDVWMRIANEIRTNMNRFDGFVVLHGTDTMAYTASALAFAMQGLPKPVILTGAQLPLGQIRNDARENLKTAMVMAANSPIAEIGLYFGDHLYRGCRSTKVSATSFDAFGSPNFPPLATVGTSISYHQNYHKIDNADSLVVHPIQHSDVLAFRLFPGLGMDTFRHILRKPMKGIVIETYGDGNGPSRNPDFLSAIRESVDNGMVIMGCTQCLHGGMTQAGYAAGTALTKAGVIPGWDMTIEACVTKMLYLFSQGISNDEVKTRLGENLVGELTIPTGS
ncbi:MAG: asparaginase [Planctomycetota bacterium]